MLKYAQAQEARLSISAQPSSYLIQLWDDGNGFDPESIKRGYGLKNMKERAQKMNAQLTIESKIGEGTRIVLELANNQITPYGGGKPL